MNDDFKILAIDPSSYFVGIALLTIDSGTYELKSIETGLLNIGVKKEVSSTHNPRFDRILLLEKLIAKILHENKPLVLTYERGFHNSKTPGAFEPLIMSTTTIINKALNIFPNITIIPFSPGKVKNAMGAKGNCNKDEMKEACRTNKRLLKFVDTTKISEHEIDAVAVGLAAFDFYADMKIILA